MLGLVAFPISFQLGYLRSSILNMLCSSEPCCKKAYATSQATRFMAVMKPGSANVAS